MQASRHNKCYSVKFECNSMPSRQKYSATRKIFGWHANFTNSVGIQLNHNKFDSGAARAYNMGSAEAYGSSTSRNLSILEFFLKGMWVTLGQMCQIEDLSFSFFSPISIYSTDLRYANDFSTTFPLKVFIRRNFAFLNRSSVFLQKQQ